MADGRAFGLLGRRLGHSWSPRIHAHLSEVPYLLHELEPEELEAFVREDAGWRGLNVTIPYKRDVLAMADELSDAVRRVGAANTLVRRADGTILADNTDVAGFALLLDRFCERELGGPAAEALSGEGVLVLGSGGASRAVVAALEDAGAEPHVISRTGDDTYATIVERHAGDALLVNTTPVGMYPDCPASPLDDATLAALAGLRGVLDVVYNPLRTGLCLAAERLGLPSESGLAMLVGQAVRSSELFQGIEIGRDAVDGIEAELRGAMLNVCLIGMPGVGKTSAGKRLARMLGRPFVDMDDVFTIDVGQTPADCIRERGEDAFRALETRELERYGRESGLVIACGGGVVTRPENKDALRQNSVVMMLDRPIDQLSSAGRPMSQAKGVARLAEERMPLYRAWADHVVECRGSAMADAVAIRDLLGLA